MRPSKAGKVEIIGKPDSQQRIYKHQWLEESWLALEEKPERIGASLFTGLSFLNPAEGEIIVWSDDLLNMLTALKTARILCKKRTDYTFHFSSKKRPIRAKGVDYTISVMSGKIFLKRKITFYNEETLDELSSLFIAPEFISLY